MMISFSMLVAFEMSQSSVSGAVGMTHHEHPLGLVQADRHAHLFEDEGLLEVVAWGRQGLGAAGDDDHVGTLDALLLQKLLYRFADPLIKAAENGRVRDVWGGRGVEMEDLFQWTSLSILTFSGA